VEVISRMAAVDELDQVLEQFQLAGNEFMKGNPKPVQDLFSHREDVTLANSFGPPVRGWEHVAATQERGASYYRDGEIYDFETVAKYVTPELACVTADFSVIDPHRMMRTEGSAEKPTRPIVHA
jgi:hypothetical protein